MSSVMRHVVWDGVYITDSDGEFYAIELAEFGRLVKAFAGAARGCTSPLRLA